ncbi:MAG: hypothetical protein LH618_10675, partial [Saprospiraceae bacterium]|nr:hypothetical protein [Saprospiraceae bacterium]
VIEDRHEGRTRFVPVRQQQVTPIATVAIYTDTDEGTIALTDVFQKMLDQYDTLPPADLNANSAVLREYFTAILPEHDRDRVHINDIKKCIKWFNFMQEKGIFAEAQREAAAAQESEEKEVTDTPLETLATTTEDSATDQPAEVTPEEAVAVENSAAISPAAKPVSEEKPEKAAETVVEKDEEDQTSA